VDTFSAYDAPSAVIQLSSPSGRKRTVPCSFHGSSAKRLSLQASEPIAVSSQVRVEFNDALFLGHVVACTTGANRACDIEIQIEQILSGLQSLMALRSHVLGEGRPQLSPVLELAVNNR
jgi:hypothetical protein